MKVRKPNFAFERALPHWSWHREFAQANNAASTTLPQLEPYLNRVMRKAKEQIPGDQKQLIADIEVFIRQEANHYQQHQRYNDTLYRAGYTSLHVFEDQLKADYEHFLNNKSLRFNVAYAEGFESLGIIYALFFFEQIDDLLEGADSDVTNLWRWHFAEEFEHRTVCYDVYQQLFGGYWYRIYGLCYAIWHLGGYGKRVTDHLLEVDRLTMPEAEQRQSKSRALGYQMRLMGFLLPRVLRIFSPFYNPRKRRAPRGAEVFLAEIEVGAG
jgi:predicted metal-dependent hydrolase